MGIYTNAIKNGEVAYEITPREIATDYNLGDGYHKVKISGSKTNLTVGDGDCVIEHNGNDSNIQTGKGNQTIKSYGNNKNIITDSGDDNVVFIGDNCNVDLSDGDNELTFIGDNCNIAFGQGDDKLVFWGHNGCIKMNEGDDSVTTFDQVYKQAKYKPLAEEFLSRLETSTWTTKQFKSDQVIDVYHKNRFLYKKYYYVHETHYNVDEYFSQHINGVKNTTIDMGEGNNTANVTLNTNRKTASKIVENEYANDTVQLNKKWQIDHYLGSYDKVSITTETHRKANWWGIATVVTAGATLAGVILDHNDVI